MADKPRCITMRWGRWASEPASAADLEKSILERTIQDLKELPPRSATLSQGFFTGHNVPSTFRTLCQPHSLYGLDFTALIASLNAITMSISHD